MATFQKIKDKIMSDGTFKDGEFILKHSRSQIGKAGRRIRKGISEDLDADIAIIQEYRAAHDKPMRAMRHFLLGLKKGQVSSRLKRLPTILDKLSRATLDGVQHNSMCATKMSDIAGCRVIVESYAELLELDSIMSGTVIEGAKFRKLRDYLCYPKSSGYRGIHRVYSFGKFDVEVQLRTRMQHVWSTAVEIVDLFEGTKLKTNPQEEDWNWREFFKLFSSILYSMDTGNISKKTYADIEALRKLEAKLSVYAKLQSFTISSTQLADEYSGIDTAVISVVQSGKMMKVETALFTVDEKLDAMATYQQKESDGMISIMVSVDDFSKLKETYPAYQVDISQFTSALKNILQ